MDTIGPFHDSITTGSRRFGIVAFDSAGAPCVALEGEPPATGTRVLLVSEDRRSLQHIGAAVTTQPLDGHCGPSSAMLEKGYGLRMTTGKAALGFGIVGAVDTLRVDHHRAVVLFPGDTAHWRFGTCTSAEGEHYVIDRVSADSLVELWDGYYHVDYDTEPSCPGPRDLARAHDERARVKEWNAGTHTHDVAMSLVVARWIRCRHAGGPVVDADAVTDSAAQPAALPPMDELLRTLGMPNDGTPEDAFILGWLGREQLDCFEGGLSQAPDSLVATAARRDTSSALFEYYRDPNKRHGVPPEARAEARRRFAGRGEHYRAILDWLREELGSG